LRALSTEVLAAADSHACSEAHIEVEEAKLEFDLTVTCPGEVATTIGECPGIRSRDSDTRETS
jgi:hypothetical protein